MRKYLTYIIMILFIISIFANLYFLFPLNNAKDSLPLPYESEVTAGEMDKPELNNPIDDFFKQEIYPNSGSTTVEINVNAMLYRDAWKAEMDNAHEMLLSRAHEELKGYIEASQEQFITFCETEIEVAKSMFSDGYETESGGHVFYGSGAPANGNYAVAKLYKQRTFDLFYYLANIGEDIAFAFDKDVFLD